MQTVGEIYQAIDQFAPFHTQEKWDNSGLLVGDKNAEVTKVVTALDISPQAIALAKEKQAELIVSHHPIIFNPIKNVLAGQPVYELIRGNCNAICVHTPLDIAEKGLNTYAYHALESLLGLENYQVLEITQPNGIGFGWVADLKEPIKASELAKISRTALKMPGMRVSRTMADHAVHRLAYCSGAGGSMLELVQALGCDGYITGDVKQDRWYAAEFAGIALMDGGHYGTEQMAAEILREQLQTAFPSLEIYTDQNDPAIWIGEEL